MGLNIIRRYFLLITSLFTLSNLVAQEAGEEWAYLVKFTYKGTELHAEKLLSQKAINRREKFDIAYDSLDYPVNQHMIDVVLKDTSIHFRYALKWHNGIVVSSNKALGDSLTKAVDFIEAIYYLGIVDELKPNSEKAFYTPTKKLKESTITTNNLNEVDYGMAYNQNQQIGVTALHRMGFDGKNVFVAVFDAGFNKIDLIPGFMKSQANNQMTFGYDWVDLDNTLNVKDNHGTAVTSCIGTYDPGKYIGSAPNANFVLFRTENGKTENPIEELNWCKAAEVADSLGVDMITSSLGYNQYDDPSLSYTHRSLDGATSFISLGASTAVQKGIFVLNSAGNEGDDKWFKIGTPADVPTVLTIGAIDRKGKIGRFSSKGPNADGVVKPDVCALGVRAAVASSYGSYYKGYGTSYATPIAAGGVACLLQAFPSKTPQEIADAIRATATQNNEPDSLMGYGIAQFQRAYMHLLAEGELKKDNIINIDKKQLIIYNGIYSSIAIKIKERVRFLGFIPWKKTVVNEQFTNNQPIKYLSSDELGIDCTKNYTLLLKLRSNVGKYKLKHNDLHLCKP
jgi:serine protease AprX